jgi:L-cysteine/cystine lyase
MTDFRQYFPALANKAYFNYGGQGPMPSSSVQAIARAYETIQQRGPFSSQAYDWVLEQSQALRGAIAVELGVDASSIALTEDVTVGCNIAMWGIDWSDGGHLLLTDCEHQGIVATAKEIQRRFQLELSVCPLQKTPNEDEMVGAIANSVQPNTKLIALSHILWNNGRVLPLKELVAACKARNPGVMLLVDAAQSVGVLPLNLSETGVDFYAFTGHKWWCGPEGVGGLYVSPEARERLSPTFIGWRSIDTDRENNPIGWKPDGRRWEIATSAYPLYAGLTEAIAIHHQWGTTEERYKTICHLSGNLWEKLEAIPGITCLTSSPPRSGLVAFTIASGQHQKLVQTLEQKNIFVRTILSPNCIRACVHYLTTLEEIDRLVSAIGQSATK